METQNVPVKKIKLVSKYHTRAKLDPKRVTEFAELLTDKEPVNFPPVVLYFDWENYWIADGYARVAAHRMSEFNEINAIVFRGGAKEAFIAGLTYGHGEQKSRRDKQEGIKKALVDPDLPWTDKEVAYYCGVSTITVSKFRKELGIKAERHKKIEIEDEIVGELMEDVKPKVSDVSMVMDEA